MASKSVEPMRALVSGRQSLGRERRRLQQKAREGPGGIRRTSARTAGSHCSPLSLRCQTAAAASRLSPHDVQGALRFRNDRALPLGRRNHSEVQPSTWARRVLERSTVNSHPRKLRLPNTRGPSQAAMKPQQTPPTPPRSRSTSVRRSRRDDQSGAHRRRSGAQNARSQIYAGSQSGSLLSRVAVGTTIQEGKSACCTWQRSAWIVQFMR
jgi:hypothetical protein